MPSFSDLPGSEGFLFSEPALVSQALTRVGRGVSPHFFRQHKLEKNED